MPGASGVQARCGFQGSTRCRMLCLLLRLLQISDAIWLSMLMSAFAGFLAMRCVGCCFASFQGVVRAGCGGNRCAVSICNPLLLCLLPRGAACSGCLPACLLELTR